MWLKSHHWVNEPHFKTERKKVLDVIRTPSLSLMLFDQKYYNCETRKFDSDKLKTLNSFSLADIVDDNEYGYGTRHKNWWWDSEKHENEVEFKHADKIITIPKFTPKDNDFDEEEKIQEKQRIEHQEKQRIALLEFEERLKRIEVREKEEENVITNDLNNLTLKQYQSAEILTIEEFNRNNFSNIRLKPNEEIIIINGQPVLDENGNIKIFVR